MDILLDFYVLSYWNVLALVCAGLIIWVCAFTKLSRARASLWKGIVGVLLVAWAVCVLWITVLTRHSQETKLINLKLFHSYYKYFFEGYQEALRLIIMNVLLFLPGGILIEELAFCRHRSGRMQSVIHGILLVGMSLLIEFVQYRFALGMAELDDIWNNMLGSIAGIYICVPGFCIQVMRN